MRNITITITIPAPMPSSHKTIEAQDIHFHLAKALNKSWFDMTGLSGLANSYGHKWYEHPKWIQAFHCVYWSEMTMEQQQRLVDYSINMTKKISGHQIIAE